MDAETLNREYLCSLIVWAPWILSEVHFPRDWKPPAPVEYEYLEYEPLKDPK